MKRILFINFLISFSIIASDKISSQYSDNEIINNIYSEALTDSFAYLTLKHLCANTKGRIAGNPMANKAVDYIYQQINLLEPDTIYLQEVQVPNWKRGDIEEAKIRSEIYGERELNITALGLSVGTGLNGIFGQIVEVRQFSDLEDIGLDSIQGKIVFFNRPMDPTLINTFEAYGGAANQRTQGASVAAEYGAIAVIVRSLSSSKDQYAHTGVLRYKENIPKIPAVAVSTADADIISEWNKADPNLKLLIRTNCKIHPDTISYNIVAELYGESLPGEIITVGGHLDAWDNSEGAHDDGAGCVQSMEVLRIFKKLNIHPIRTIRIVMFMDEEIDQRGGKEYARQSKLKEENHIFALESDRGAFTPLGFGFSGPKDKVNQCINMKSFFSDYNLHLFQEGGGGVDISFLKNNSDSIVLSSYIPDWQRYFDYHHSGSDSFDKIHFRELQAGSAAITVMIYLVDKYF